KGALAPCPPSRGNPRLRRWARCRFAHPTVRLNFQTAFTVVASEAKQSIPPRRKHGLLRRYAPRNDEEIRLRLPATQVRPSDASNVSLKIEGAGNAGCRPHPWPACNKKAGGSHHRYAKTPRHSLRNGLRLIPCSPW